ncbi:MAG: hypothetical protein HQ537_01710 [Parcubacteria group bacterium]|nr:hypothetical protein [Parcubacteria group bacterium]
MDEKTKEAFKVAVEELLNEEIGDNQRLIRFPRALFAGAVHLLKKGKEIDSEEHVELMKQFSEILKEINIRVDSKSFLKFLKRGERRKNPNRSSWITPQVMKDARAHEIYHSKRSQG